MIETLEQMKARYKTLPDDSPAQDALAHLIEDQEATARCCAWVVDDDGLWRSSCENVFFFDTDGPHENGFKFCPYCGKGMDAVHANR